MQPELAAECVWCTPFETLLAPMIRVCNAVAPTPLYRCNHKCIHKAASAALHCSSGSQSDVINRCMTLKQHELKFIFNLHLLFAVAAATVTPAPARPQVAATPSGPLAEAAAAPAAIPDQAPSGQSSLFSADVAPAKLKPGVYARGRHTQEVATAQLAKVTGGTR